MPDLEPSTPCVSSIPLQTSSTVLAFPAQFAFCVEFQLRKLFSLQATELELFVFALLPSSTLPTQFCASNPRLILRLESQVAFQQSA